ncbi:MAG: hypothetical protein ABIP50_02790 [Candidatus Saccharimonadales bacterium]
MATKKKATPAKKPTASKARVSKAKAVPPMKSFVMSPDTKPFSSMKITRQTVYWIILVGFIVFSQLWIVKLQLDISSLTDSLVTIQNSN